MHSPRKLSLQSNGRRSSLNNDIPGTNERRQSLIDHAGASIFQSHLDVQSSTDISVSVSVPGKVILHGEHSVVYGKLAIAGSLGLRTRVNLVEQGPNCNGVCVELRALNLSHCYYLSDIQNLVDQPLPLIKNSSNYNLEKPDVLNHDALLNIVQTFIDQHVGSFPLNYYQKLSLSALFYLFYGIFGSLDFPIRPLHLMVETDLTISAGTGSSASYLVGVTAAFYQYVRLRARRGDCRDNLSRNGYKAIKPRFDDVKKFDRRELELISKWAYCAERIIHGSPSGVDNTICTFGSMVEFRKSSGAKVVDLPNKFKILLVNTKVPRETKVLVTRVATLREKHTVLVDTILDAMNTIAQNALECFSTISNKGKAVGNGLGVKELYEKLGELADMNHNLLKALQVSHPKLDEICAVLTESGLRGKLTGAGGGGYAIAVVPPYLEESAVKDLVSKLETEGYEVVLTDLGGPGVLID